MILQNRQMRAWTLPATADGIFPSVTLNPGAHAEIDAEHWNTVRKGNIPIDALLQSRHLVTLSSDPEDRPHLSNPETAGAPTELREDPEGTTRKSKTETVSVDLSEPEEATSKRGRKA